MDAGFQLQVQVILYLNGLKANGYYSPWSEQRYNFSADLASNLEGSLNFTEFMVTGFKNMSYSMSDGVQVTLQEDESFSVCLNNLFMDNAEFGIKYQSDMGLDDEIPFYGDGELSFQLQNVNFSMCSVLAADKSTLSDVKLKMTYRHQPVTITGLFKNDEFSKISSEALSTFSRVYAMWNLYETDCSSCILSPLFQYFVNAQIGEKTPGDLPRINCTCLEENIQTRPNLWKVNDLMLELTMGEDLKILTSRIIIQDIQKTFYGDLSEYLKNDELRRFIFLLLDKFVTAFSPT